MIKLILRYTIKFQNSWTVGFKSFLEGQEEYAQIKVNGPRERDTGNPLGTRRPTGLCHHSHSDSWDRFTPPSAWGAAKEPARLPLPHASQPTGLPSSWFFSFYVNKQNSYVFECVILSTLGLLTWWLRSDCIEKTKEMPLNSWPWCGQDCKLAAAFFPLHIV